MGTAASKSNSWRTTVLYAAMSTTSFLPWTCWNILHSAQTITLKASLIPRMSLPSCHGHAFISQSRRTFVTTPAGPTSQNHLLRQHRTFSSLPPIMPPFHLSFNSRKARDGVQLPSLRRSISTDNSKTSSDSCPGHGNGDNNKTTSSDEQPKTAYTPPDSQVESETLNWIKRVVVKLSLCPFADKPIRENKLRTHVVRGSDEETVTSAVLYELLLRKDDPGTAIVIAPECYPDDFTSYLSLLSVIEEGLMVDWELHGHVQIAPFHPLFQFDGSGSDGVDNYTNRSPYPMFHILREDEVGDAVDLLHGDSSKVWQRNVDLLRDLDATLGREAVERIMKGEKVEGMEDVLRRGKKLLDDDGHDDENKKQEGRAVDLQDDNKHDR